MNKKIYNLAICVFIAVIGLLILTGCGKKINLDEIKLTDEIAGIETTIKYPKDIGIVAELNEESSLPEISLTNEGANYVVEFYYEETSKNSLEYDKENAMEDDESNYQEVTYSGYEGFQYDDSYYNGKQIVLTTGNYDENDNIISLNILVKSFETYDDNGDRVDFAPIFESEDIKTILNNISINENFEKTEVDGTISDKNDLVVKKFDAPEGYTLQQTGESNGVINIYFLDSEKAKYNNSSADVRIGLRDNFDYYENAEAAAKYYSTDTRKYEKTEHNGITFYVYESTDKDEKFTHIQDIYFDLDGHIFNIAYSLYEDVPEEIGNLLIDNVIENMYVYNK